MLSAHFFSPSSFHYPTKSSVQGSQSLLTKEIQFPEAEKAPGFDFQE